MSASLVLRASHHIRRQFKRARKESLRRFKFAQGMLHRVQHARKDWYFRARETAHGRTLLNAAWFVRTPFDLVQRRNAVGHYAGRTTVPEIDRAKGYTLLSFERDDRFAPVLATCRRLFEIKKAELEALAADFDSWPAARQAKYLTRKQSFFRYLLDDDDLRQNPALVEFALSDVTLGAAAKYLGMVPLLSRVDLIYSLPRPGEPIDSQLFHVDPEGLSQLKFFVHLFDVGTPEGPFTFLPADASARIVHDVRRLRRERGSPAMRRFRDDEVFAVGGQPSLVTVEGPAGTGVAVDTSRCLHLGSRVQPGVSRVVLYLQYCTTREQTNVFDVERFGGNPVHDLAVRHSLERGRSTVEAYQPD